VPRASLQLAGSLILLAACSGHAGVLKPAGAQDTSVEVPALPRDLEGVEITLVRSECGGGYCPNYTVVIDGKGRVKYTGRSYVRDIGEREGTLSEGAVRKLLLRFEYAKFFAFNDKYRESARDCATTYLTIRIGDRVKRVENYWANNDFEIPPEKFDQWRAQTTLGMLARSIDKAVKIEQWIGTRDERDELRAQWRPGRDGRTDLPK
jgi:hypothetical protein